MQWNVYNVELGEVGLAYQGRRHCLSLHAMHWKMCIVVSCVAQGGEFRLSVKCVLQWKCVICVVC